MTIELKEMNKKGETASISRKIVANFLRNKEKKEDVELAEIYKNIFWYGLSLLILVMFGFLVGWFASEFHHTPPSEEVVSYGSTLGVQTDKQCQVEGEVMKGSTCLHFYTCTSGYLVEAGCPKYHQYDLESKSCQWIHLATCQEGDESFSGGDMGAGGTSDEAEETSEIDNTPSEIDDKAPTLQQVLDTEVRIIMKHGLQRVRRSISTRSNEEVERVKPLSPDNPENVKIVERLVSSRKWEFFFPIRNAVYSYRSFLQAVAKFSGFCDTEEVCKLSLAVIFAHFTQETGGHDRSLEIPEWRQGLYFVEEAGCSDRDCGYSKNCAQATWLTETWPCQKDKNGKFHNYHGRGAKQISYNYNYGQFSTFMFDNATVLLEQPQLIANSWLALASAIWFFLMPQPPKPSMLEVVEASWQPNSEDLSSNLLPGFGLTTNIINGGVECNKETELQQSINRQQYFRHFYSELKISNTRWLQNLGCSDMKEFPSEGAGSQDLYWEQNWSRKYYCKLVSYATPYNALVAGDYLRCVEEKFNLKISNA